MGKQKTLPVDQLETLRWETEASQLRSLQSLPQALGRQSSLLFSNQSESVCVLLMLISWRIFVHLKPNMNTYALKWTGSSGWQTAFQLDFTLWSCLWRTFKSNREICTWFYGAL
jgi:hypothetical protein